MPAGPRAHASSPLASLVITQAISIRGSAERRSPAATGALEPSASTARRHERAGDRQHMRGSGSPSGSAISRRPKPVSRMSIPGRSLVQVPMIAASTAERMASQRPEHAVRNGAFTPITSLALIGSHQRVDSHESESAGLRTDRQRRLVQDDADTALGGHLVQGARNSAAGRILHRGDRPGSAASASRIRPLIGATSDKSGPSAQAVARRHDRHPVVAKSAGHNDAVAGLQASSRAPGTGSARCRWC